MTDAEIIRFAAEFREGLLGKGSSRDQCAVVSYPLAALLRSAGVDAREVDGNPGHVWIALADGRVLDATGDQFALEEVEGYGMTEPLPPVYLGPPTPLHRALAPRA